MRRFLVALDGSPRSPDVLLAAAELARCANARLVLYRAITTPVPITAEDVDARRGDAMRETAELDLERLARTLAPGLVDVCRVELAQPWDGICRAARSSECDLVVIGSHGYGRIDRLLGTTAAKVVNHTDRNVLVVRVPR